MLNIDKGEKLIKADFFSNMKQLGINCKPNVDKLTVEINGDTFTPFAFLPDQKGIVYESISDCMIWYMDDIVHNFNGHNHCEKILNIETILMLSPPLYCTPDLEVDINNLKFSLYLYEGDKIDVNNEGEEYTLHLGWQKADIIAFEKCPFCGSTTFFDGNQGWICRNCGKGLDKYYELEDYYKTYGNYIASDEWIEKKKNVLKRDNFTCVRCGKKGTRLHVHHLNYDNLYNEESNNYSDLITLCESCHKWMHESEEQ